MSVAVRGIRNTFRNKIRGGAVVLVLAIVIGLTLSMLVANEAVAARLESVRSKLDTTVTAAPAFAPKGEDTQPLTADQLTAIRGLDHVASATGIVQGMLEAPSDGEDDKSGGPRVSIAGPSGAKGTTNLESGVDAAAMGAPAGVKFPIMVGGTDGTVNARGQALDITDGRALQASDTRGAVISDQLAKKNGLSVGGTFTAFDQTFTVVGIAASGGTFDDVGVVMTAETLMDLGDQSGYTSIVAKADDVANLEAVKTKIGELLGGAVEVHAETETALQATQGLETVERITRLGFLICLFCAAVIVFFTLALTVRERRKEVGVLKAIGATTRGIVGQFGVEAVTLVLAATILGLGVAALTSNVIADVLVSTNTPANEAGGKMPGMPAGAKAVRIAGPGGGEPESAADLIGEVTAGLGWDTLGLGAATALVIAVLGAAAPAWLIARVRPAEVLRGE
ncbi:hypothetical protein Afil01_26590 [Actinorhabdospora filicis]|uniref:ABC transport system permease protein n=1 Tax=Actinorhabdospora filicis TaxID=1785913 RepID=A0A9W6SL82_9ACTN|nr:ABC transporter permease [Actinorhabdospora filicis]GLZ77852.1 hypothetical protein Afil01_26590 [Actinorhabdospora filicis]